MHQENWSKKARVATKTRLQNDNALLQKLRAEYEEKKRKNFSFFAYCHRRIRDGNEWIPRPVLKRLAFKKKRQKRVNELNDSLGRKNLNSWRDDMNIVLRIRDGDCCKMCDEKVDALTIDHIVPLFKGGTSRLHNLQLLCRPCHDIKSEEEQE